MDLAPFIRELILLNECVILPGFGGFETSYQPAHYDTLRKCMLPPTKRLRFRPDFVKGGGTLEQYLVTRLKISEDEAKKLVVTYVEELVKRIDAQREAIISGVGLFTKGLGNGLNFTAFEEENYLAESFGLEAFSLENPLTKPAEPVAKELILQPRRNTLTLVVIGIVVICVLMAFTAILSARFDIYLFNFGNKQSENDLIILGPKADVDTSLHRINQQINESTHIKNALLYSETQTEEDKSEQKYYLVAGSFKTEKNAKAIEHDLFKEGYLPQVFFYQGYYRVSIAMYTDKIQALNELQRLRRQTNRTVWLLVVEE